MRADWLVERQLFERQLAGSSHGETIPAARPTAPPASAPPGADRFLNGLNPDNPKVAAALKACQSKLPSFASGA